MKKILLTLVATLLAAGASAQTQQRSALLTYNYDLASTSYIYCKYLGRNGDPWGIGGGMEGPARIKTSGSSTTVVENDSGTNPFAQIAVGDLLTLRYGGTDYKRRVATRTSAAEITVDAAIDLTNGSAFQWYQQQCGTAATDGWLDMNLFGNMNFLRTIATINAASIDTQVECRLNANPAISYIVDTTNATTTGGNAVVVWAGVWDACRVGLKVNTDAGAQSVTVAAAFKR